MRACYSHSKQVCWKLGFRLNIGKFVVSGHFNSTVNLIAIIKNGVKICSLIEVQMFV